jgi:hypothetical protein
VGTPRAASRRSEKNQEFSRADVRHVPCNSAGIVHCRFLARVTAWLLAVLIVLPFTAPFSSCDVSMLLPPETHASAVAIHHHGAVASITEANDQSAGGSFLDEERFKNAAIAVAMMSVVVPAPSASIGAASIHSAAPRLPLVSLRL